MLFAPHIEGEGNLEITVPSLPGPRHILSVRKEPSGARDPSSLCPCGCALISRTRRRILMSWGRTDIHLAAAGAGHVLQSVELPFSLSEIRSVAPQWKLWSPFRKPFVELCVWEPCTWDARVNRRPSLRHPQAALAVTCGASPYRLGGAVAKASWRWHLS